METIYTLAKHNQDIKCLLEKGYALSIDNNFLVVRDIPYLDENKNLAIGAIVTKIVFIDTEHIKLEDHQIFFCGSQPCQIDGSYIQNLGGGATSLALSSQDLVVQRSFSNKPTQGFTDFYEKIESYVTIISGPAMTLYDVTPFTFRVVEESGNSVFKLRDTLTSRAEIGDLSSIFKEEVVAIIGLGGTGSYLLDLLVKTPVKEIRGFDLDDFNIHNAFRSPGKLNTDELGKNKAEVYQNRYDNFRMGLNINSKYIVSDSTDELCGVTFAFICVDNGASRSEIINLLIELRIPFIDVGMGLARDCGPISGMIRSTYFSRNNAQEVLDRNLVPISNLPDDIYKNNIQIAELNALNACIALIKYKQIKGFYQNDDNSYHLLFTIDNLHMNVE
ncbi:MAG: ThiF family adenylyltransferase [Bacteroidota bacterium]|nr:ThiF family adenylyltransferase [Bacteroidota bacterium]